MPIDEDCQEKTNNRVELQFAAFNDALAKELASIGITDPSIAEPIATPYLLPLVRAKSEHLKEHDTRYNQNMREWREADRKRREEGRDEYNADRRGDYAGEIMETERRRVRPYGIPNSPQKQANRNEQKKRSKRAKETERQAAMTDAERDADRAVKSAERKARRHAAKKAEQSAKSG